MLPAKGIRGNKVNRELNLGTIFHLRRCKGKAFAKRGGGGGGGSLRKCDKINNALQIGAINTLHCRAIVEPLSMTDDVRCWIAGYRFLRR